MKNLTNFIKQQKGHFIAWACFIAYEVLVVGFVAGVYASFLDYAAHYAVNILLFYVHATLLLPFCLEVQRKRLWLLPLLILAQIGGYLALMYGVGLVLTRYLDITLTRPLEMDYIYAVRSVWRAIYFMGFSTGYYFFISALRERRRADASEKQQLLHIIEKQQLEHELVRSRHSFLKAQINPHFLFNTLNFVYNSVRKTSAPAAEAVMSLSEMMRYALQSEDEQQEVELLEEIAQAEHLIRLHQVRNEHRYHLALTCGPNLEGIKLIPLVLLTLVENMFKHGDLAREAYPASIDIRLESDQLCITTANRKLATQPSGHRIGLENLQLRLAHTYGKKASLKAWTDESGYFRVSLQVSGKRSSSAPIPSRQQQELVSC